MIQVGDKVKTINPIYRHYENFGKPYYTVKRIIEVDNRAYCESDGHWFIEDIRFLQKV